MVGDIENYTTLAPLQNRQFDMVLCIEAWHTLPDPLATVVQVKKSVK